MVGPVSNAVMPDQSFVLPTSSTLISNYNDWLGRLAEFPDIDVSSGVVTTNSDRFRQSILVRNGSGVDITPGMALNWVSGYWGHRVQACPAGADIRCFAPSYNNGLTTTVFPDLSYFYATYHGPMSPLSDGSAIAIDDGLTIGSASGKVKSSGSTGGVVYSNTAVSANISNTTTPTLFDKNYTFPANSLKAGDVITLFAHAKVTNNNGSDTLNLIALFGGQAMGATGAIDVATGDGFVFNIQMIVRSIGASGVLEYSGTVNTATGSVTFKSFSGTLTIDTTTTNQVGIQATWNAASTSDVVRLDELTLIRGALTSGSRSGGLAIAAAAAGSAVQFRANVNCLW